MRLSKAAKQMIKKLKAKMRENKRREESVLQKELPKVMIRIQDEVWHQFNEGLGGDQRG